MNIRRLIGLAATSLMITAAPALAGPQCLKMPSGRTLEAEAKAGRPTNELVEALLRDAEKIYAEGARIVGQRPRTDAESHAIPEKDFRVEECHFQNAFSSASKDDIGQPERIQWTLIRIEQFDNFDAVNGCDLFKHRSRTASESVARVTRSRLDAVEGWDQRTGLGPAP
jgi:hypothetical protein